MSVLSLTALPLESVRAGVRVMLTRDSDELRSRHGVIARESVGTIVRIEDVSAIDLAILVDWGSGVSVRVLLDDLVAAPVAHPHPGFWVVLEGGDSVGKTTQMDFLEGRLYDTGHSVVRTREPGGTLLGEELRALILHGEHVDPRAEALLYAADRAHHVAEKVAPALRDGNVVLQDRFSDSSVVYQGIVRGLGVERIGDLSEWAAQGLRPDLVIVLDREPLEIQREVDRIESETASAASVIRGGFLQLAEADPERHVVIDASRSIPEVSDDIWDAVINRLSSAPGSAAA